MTACLMLWTVVLVAGCASNTGPRAAHADLDHADRLALAAQNAAPDDAGDLWLAAAEAYANDQQSDQAQRALSRVGAITRSEYPVRVALLRAQLAVDTYHPARALDILATLPDRLPAAQAVQVAIITALADQARGRLDAAASARIAVDHLITDKPVRTKNERAIWDILQSLPPRQLLIPPQDAGPTARAWWSLAAIAMRQGATEQTAFRQAVSGWRADHPHHPANHVIVPDLLGGKLRQSSALSQVESWPESPHHVALLLPFSGKFAPAGREVADGFNAMQEAAADGGIEISRLDTHGTATGVRSAYRSALRAQADLVIGPLTRAAVNAMAEQMPLPVPLLALNHPRAEFPPLPGMLVFDLAPAREAAATAEAAYDRGYRRAALLCADNERGRRMASAFAKRFQSLGGRIATEDYYPPAGGERLNRQVRGFLGGPPRLWRDGAVAERIDALFLQGPPRDVRLIRPLLRFYHAAQLPVYATGEVYADTAAKRINLDLDGIIVCDSPAALAAAANGNGYTGVRLRALGADAYRLIQALPQLRGDPGASIAGASGRLSLGGTRYIRRGLTCVPFHGGRPALSPTTVQASTMP